MSADLFGLAFEVRRRYVLRTSQAVFVGMPDEQDPKLAMLVFRDVLGAADG